ncbi:MAG: trypsin-like peptidase domain-containing protein [Oleibacter sp.]|nr:trypsin-like peptidase domain-containing protein [Thalassolituus sp.]
MRPILFQFVLPSALGCLLALAIVAYWPSQGAISPAMTSTLKANNTAENIRKDLHYGQVSYSQAVKQAAPAVVNIFTKKLVENKINPLLSDPVLGKYLQVPESSQNRLETSLGSGVILTDDGYIITNYHVIQGADEVVVALIDGREAVARVIGVDNEADLAVLKVDLQPLTTIPMAQSRNISIGDVVLAIGNPFNVGQTVTMGIVSATGRSGLGLNTFENYIQTDAAINPGNSGGALINALGELVGINTAIFSKSGGNEGIGFAIPAWVALQAQQDIATYGTRIRGWLGIEVQEANTELLSRLNLPEALSGLIVRGVVEDGPAAMAGLSVGDIITSINDDSSIKAQEALNLIANLRPGDMVKVTFLHDGKERKTRAIAGQRKPQQNLP